MALSIPNDIIPTPDLEQVRRALDVLVPPGSTFEVRGLPSRRSYVGRDIDAAVNAIRGMAADQGIYWTLNPLRPDQSKAASDRDVMRRARLMVDVDPVRPKEDGCATDSERREAQQVANEIYRDLGERSWPDPVVIDTGNGVQLIYAIDLPNNEQSRLWVRGVLEKLTATYSTDHAKVDTSVHNASRISRVPGTWNRKGTNSPTRPHRMSQVMRWPASFDVVGAELIQDFVGATQAASVPAVNGTPNLLIPIALPENGTTAWYQKAMRNERYKVMMAEPGERHNQLRSSTLALAGYIHHGAFDEPTLRAEMVKAGMAINLPEKECLEVVEWAISKGKESPIATHKVDMVDPGTGAVKTIEIARPIIWANEVVCREVEWLWYSRIPLGKMTTFAGPGGVGKTFVLCDLAARVSTGAELPFSGGARAPKGKVLFISGEDDLDDTLVPRLTRLGADLSQIGFLSPESEKHFSLGAIELLKSLIDYMDETRLIVIDPPTSYLNGVDDHKNAELRGLLTPLKQAAAEKRVAIVFNNHINKSIGTNTDAAARVMGSVAWVNAPRVAHMFVRQEEEPDNVYFGPIKINISEMPRGLVYTIRKTSNGPMLEWIGEDDRNANQAMNRTDGKSKKQQAREWLEDRFREQRTWLQRELRTRATAEEGWSYDTLNDARKTLPIDSHPGPGDKSDRYTWTARPGWPPVKEEAKWQNSKTADVSPSQQTSNPVLPPWQNCPTQKPNSPDQFGSFGVLPLANEGEEANQERQSAMVRRLVGFTSVQPKPALDVFAYLADMGFSEQEIRATAARVDIKIVTNDEGVETWVF
jgi:hypothetical protein